MAILSAGGVALPAPVSLSVSDQIIWSASTGRTASGTMAGDVVASKKTLEIRWGILTAAQYALIRDHLTTGFFPVTFQDAGAALTISAYRGELKSDQIGQLLDGVFYYRSVTVTIVQQ